ARARPSECRRRPAAQQSKETLMPRRRAPFVLLLAALAALVVLDGTLAFPLLTADPAVAPSAPAGTVAAAAAEVPDHPATPIYAAASLRDVLREMTPGLEKAAGAKCIF